MYMLDRYLKLLEIDIWVKIAHFLICKLAIYHETMDFSVADRTNVFLSFLVVYLNYRSISVVDSISVMSKYNMMHLKKKYDAIQNPLHRPNVSCP